MVLYVQENLSLYINIVLSPRNGNKNTETGLGFGIFLIPLLSFELSQLRGRPWLSGFFCLFYYYSYIYIFIIQLVGFAGYSFLKFYLLLP